MLRKCSSLLRSKGLFKLKFEFSQENFNKFSEKMQKIQESHKKNSKTSRLIFPGALIIGSLLVYQGWKTVPYGKMFEHFTVSELINQKGYYHAIFLSQISFQTDGHFLIYFPLMAYGLLLNARFLNPGYFLLFYVSNSILTTSSVYLYEKYYKKQKMIVPKCLGACTTLANLFCFLSLNPNYLIFGSRLLPYFFLPAIIGMYEINEYYGGYVNEISRPAHLVSMVYGLIFGMIAKKFIVF